MITLIILTSIITGLISLAYKAANDYDYGYFYHHEYQKDMIRKNKVHNDCVFFK